MRINKFKFCRTKVIGKSALILFNCLSNYSLDFIILLFFSIKYMKRKTFPLQKQLWFNLLYFIALEDEHNLNLLSSIRNKHYYVLSLDVFIFFYYKIDESILIESRNSTPRNKNKWILNQLLSNMMIFILFSEFTWSTIQTHFSRKYLISK